MRHAGLLCAAGTLLTQAAVADVPARDWPMLTWRNGCGASHGEAYRQIVDIVRSHPGSFDEFWITYTHAWFSDAKIARDLKGVAARAEMTRAAGIRVGDQQGVTVGHGVPSLDACVRNPADRLTIPDDALAVGRAGQKLTCCCPRAPFILAREEWFVEQVCRVVHPESLWLDDDLRNGLGKPDGCFCDRCIKAFNAETGRQVTRQELVGRLFGGDDVDAIRGEWFAFNERSLALFAAAARRGANKADPSVRLCLQSMCAAFFYSGHGRRAALWELSDHGKQQTGLRCGSGIRTEPWEPHSLIGRLQHIMRETVRCRAYGDWLGTVTYENDPYTHQVLNKSCEAMLKENAMAMALGCDAAAVSWYEGARDEPLSYFDELAEGLAAWRPYYERLSAVARKTLPGGVAHKLPADWENRLPETLRKGVDSQERSLSFHYSYEHPVDVRLALYGIPVTVDVAKPQAWYEPADVWMPHAGLNNPTTAELEDMRNLFDARSNNTVPVRLGKTHALVVWPRVDAAGRLVSVSFFNASMGRAKRVPVRLRNPVGTQFEWMSGETKPQALSSTAGSLPGERIVTMPDLPGYDIGTIFVKGEK